MQRRFVFYDIRYKAMRGYFYIDGKRVRRFLCTFEQAGLDDSGNSIDKSVRAAKRLDAMLDRLHRNKEQDLLEGEKRKAPSAPPIKELIGIWIKVSAGTMKPGTVELYKYMRDQYLEAVKEHPLYDIDERTGSRRYALRHADSFRVWLQERDLKAATVHQRLRTLRTFLNWLVKRGELDQVPAFDMPKKEKKIVKSLSDEQIARLFEIIAQRQAKANTDGRAWFHHLHERYLMAAVATGRRLGEIHSRQWKDFNLDTGVLFVGYEDDADFSVKDREETWVELPATLVNYLEELREQFPKEVWLMDNGEGKLAFKRKALTRAFGRYITDPVSDRPSRTGGLGLKGQGFKATHSFRAGYITQLFRDGVDLETVRRSVGHSSLEVTRGYLTEPDALMKKAVKKFDKHLSKIVSRRHLRVVEGGK